MTAKYPLAFIFDIDGTLIAEGDNVVGVQIRPGAVAFLQTCRQRNHRVALWTAAPQSWAATVLRKLCTAVHPDHQCTGGTCRKTFDFCWAGDKQRAQRSGKMSNENIDTCQWCQFYSSRCQRCCCFAYVYECPCRYVKDLGKVWYGSDPETQGFIKDRTLIIENTPQQCIYNYGNAIYVPTYKGGHRDDIFDQLRVFMEDQLEPETSVRAVRKCFHRSGPHACFEQVWWTTLVQGRGQELVCQPITIATETESAEDTDKLPV